MAFTSYTLIGDVAQAYCITLRLDEFLLPLPISEHLRAELSFALDHVPFDRSETAVCENLIYPILREVWKQYTDYLTLWSHLPLYDDADLSGTPDYFVARKSPLGHWVLERPHLLIVEAKKDDFSRGWGQCLAAMLAAQKLHDPPAQTVYGIATNGRFWEFGQLEGTTLTRDRRAFGMNHLEELFAAVNAMFDLCRRQVVDPSRAA